MGQIKQKQNNLLLEIGFEELPADYLFPAAQQLKTDTEKLLQGKNVSYKEIKVFWTVRRFILYITDMSDKQKDINFIKKGPRYDIAYKDGKLTDIGKTFFEKNKLTEKDVEIKEENGIKYLFASIFEKGEKTEKVLSENLPLIIKNLKFPKSMVWDDTLVTFARPIRWILCLLNNKVIKFKCGKVISSSKTYLHKFEQNNKEIKIKSSEHYFEIIDKNGILIEQEQRKNKIIMLINKLLKNKNLQILKDEELLDKIASSVEMISVMIGEFDNQYLSLPQEVIITAMREHQRYFAVTKKDGQFTNYFINIRDGGQKNNDFVVKQHSKVLFSRLNDASFFYKEDLKIPIEKNIDKLKEAVFITGLGSMYEKVVRLKNYCSQVNTIINYNETDVLTKSAELCKADLMTNMISEKEFVGLRGFMGGIYLKEQGHSERIYKAVMEHYYPNFVGDKLPVTTEGVLLSLFDKIDNLYGYFLAGFKPTGSKDPYAVRRQALNIIYMITEKKLDIDLVQLFNIVSNNYEIQFKKTIDLNEIIEFFKQRQINYLKDREVDYDIINSIIDATPLNFSDNMQKAIVLMEARKNTDFNDIIFALSRINNIIPADFIFNGVKEEYFDSNEEKVLYMKFKENKDKIDNLIQQKNFNQVFNLIASFKPEIDNYFNKVLVNTDDDLKRNNRLNMLYEIRAQFIKFVNFSKIVVDRK